MVQRYVSPDQVSIEQEFDLVRGTWEFCAHFNVAPLHIVPVIRVVEGQPDLVPLRWGFGDADSATLPIEMLQCAAPAAPAPATPVDPALLARAQRCIVPALGYYAWPDEPGRKRPLYLHAEDQAVFGFAGLWEHDCCSLITLRADALQAGAARMPALLAREMRDIWLYGGAAHAAAALLPYPSERLVAYAVSDRVIRSDDDDEKLIEPLETDVD